MRKIFLLLALILGIGGAYYGWSEFNRKAADPADLKAELSVDANALLSAYEANEEAANAQYTGKSVEVKGTVREIKKNARRHSRGHTQYRKRPISRQLLLHRR